MDYKKLIEQLKAYDYWAGESDINSHPLICDVAATAIETLLAERDAAVEALSDRPHHSTCKYGETCDYVSVITG